MKNIRIFFQAKDSNKKPRIDSELATSTLELEATSSVVGGETSDLIPSSSKKRGRESEDADKDTTVVAESASTTPSTVAKMNDVVFGWPPFDEMEAGWRSRLKGEYRKPYFQKLLKFLEKETQSQIVFPPSSQIFTALNSCPYDNVKVVVIGQDPYHGPGQAHGLAFSVQKGVAIPPSLRNMITEAQNDPKVHIPTPPHGNLLSWCNQGVLMLNAVLTVRKGDANSHQKQGWEEFTDAIVKELGKKEGIVYLLWGKPAQNKCAGINQSKNIVITASHPSPLSAYKTNQPFIGSRMFSRCNDALVSLGKEPIDWTIR